MPTTPPTDHADAQMCRQCRGLCCQGHPGVWTDPEHFLKSFDLPRPSRPEILRNMLPRELVLREIDGIAIPAPQKLEQGCVFLDDDGCQLPENRRPTQCLALIPVIETLIEGEIHCELRPEGSTLTAIKNWQSFWTQA